MLIHRQAVNQPSTFTKGEIKMIKTQTVNPDSTGFADYREIAPNVFYSEATKETIISDGANAVKITTTICTD